MRAVCTAAAQRLRSVNRRVGVGVGNFVGIFRRVRAVAESDAADTLIGGRRLLQAELPVPESVAWDSSGPQTQRHNTYSTA